MAAPPRPQRGTAAEIDSAGTLIKHTAGTEGARPEHGVLPCCEYGLLAPTGLVVNPAATGNQGSVDGHEATRGTADQVRRETEAGDGTRQRVLPERGMKGADNKEKRPPGQSCANNACGHQGGEGKRGPPTQQHVTTARIQGPGGDTQTRQPTPLAQGQGPEE